MKHISSMQSVRPCSRYRSHAIKFSHPSTIDLLWLCMSLGTSRQGPQLCYPMITHMKGRSSEARQWLGYPDDRTLGLGIHPSMWQNRLETPSRLLKFIIMMVASETAQTGTHHCLPLVTGGGLIILSNYTFGMQSIVTYLHRPSSQFVQIHGRTWYICIPAPRLTPQFN